MATTLESPKSPKVSERPRLATIQTNRHSLSAFDAAARGNAYDDDSEREGDGDIYRGGGRPSSDASSLSSSSSGSSSSSSSGFIAGPLGALTAIVDHAISRWARGVRRGRRSSGSSTSSSSSSGSSSSSSSSSSSNSSTSINTLARTKRRLKARSSQGSLLSIQSERDIMAHISRLKALQESRRVPRQFGLYLPPTLEIPGQSLGVVMEGADDARTRRVISTTSLSFTINRLEAIMKTSRGRKPRGRGREPSQVDEPASHSPISRLPSRSSSELRKSRGSFPAFAASKKRKGKRRAVTAVKSVPSRPMLPSKVSKRLMPKAWFLDVASPTWADLSAIGKLLHIHPLTLEDILQQDPREKLELFPKLGYYFISFRAIESKAERARMQRDARKHADMSGSDPDAADIPMGEANVYLVVFNDGICCFHFRDISDHLERVRNRIVLLDEVVNMSSDWIAHGILDSIVDSFFPFFTEIEKEVMDIDDLVYADADAEESSDVPEVVVTEVATPSTIKQELPSSQKESSAQLEKEEKRPSVESNSSEESIRPHFTAPRPTLGMLFRRLRRYIIGFWHRFTYRAREQHRPSKVNPRITTLRRMAKTRRLVTNLGRSLAGKSEVVTRIRKRLLQQGLEPALGNGGSKREELEVAIYMGDIHDHILTLQSSLNHMERMLSQSHPSYLSQLRMNLARTKGGSDMALVYLTVISIAVLCCQAVTGTFSMNITLPSNRAEPGYPLNVFGIAISLVCVVLTGYLSLVHHWWKSSKRRRTAMLH